jgi:hypothetical protein
VRQRIDLGWLNEDMWNSGKCEGEGRSWSRKKMENKQPFLGLSKKRERKQSTHPPYSQFYLFPLFCVYLPHSCFLKNVKDSTPPHSSQKEIVLEGYIFIYIYFYVAFFFYNYLILRRKQ